MTTLRVVVVNFNSGAWLQRCVTALRQSTGPMAITVVDNDSDDVSADYCRELAAQGPVEVRFNASNRGFGPACNQVALACAEDRVCFVNPDCEVAPGALQAMRQALERDATAALCGALVRDPDGGLQRASLRRLPSPKRTLVTALGLERLGLAGVNVGDRPPAAVTPVEAVSGALMMVRSDAFRAVGGFDEGFFLHCEDLDLFWRLRQAGWNILLAPAAEATHAKGVSHVRRPLSAHRAKHRSLKRYFRRHVARSLPGAALWCLGIELHFWLTAPRVVWRGR